MSTGTATPGSAGADLFTATQHIVSHAEAGGIRSKLRAVKTFAEGLDYEASSLERWAQRLAEPDQAYPPVVWEPISRAAAHMRAAQQLLGESDSALTSIIGATVGEAARKVASSDYVTPSISDKPLIEPGQDGGIMLAAVSHETKKG